MTTKIFCFIYTFATLKLDYKDLDLYFQTKYNFLFSRSKKKQNQKLNISFHNVLTQVLDYIF